PRPRSSRFSRCSPSFAGPCQMVRAYDLLMKLVALFVVAATGCSAVSAVGELVKPKPPQITINNHVEVAPVPASAPAAKPSATPAMVAGGLTGAVAGGLA